METYQQIHDFTPAGAKRFAAFLAAQALPGVSADVCRMECLGVFEDALNDGLGVLEDNLMGTAAAPLSWELGAVESVTGKPAIFNAELGDLIVEIVNPAE
jgi:hypothetical protein